jgi:hypothetical protein
VDGDIKPALESIRKHTRIYPLSEAGKEHAEVPNKNGSMLQLNTVPPNTYLFWEYLNGQVQDEPVGLMGPEITGQMAAIGIEKGKPFEPDARMKKILTEAAAVGNATARAMSFVPRDEKAYYYGKSSAWFTVAQGGYKFENNGASDLDGRTAFYYSYTGIKPAKEHAAVGAGGSQHAIAAKDSKGNWLDGGKTYKLTLPPNIPHKNFWSVTLYDTQTRSLLQTDYRYPALGDGDGFPEDGKYFGSVKQSSDGSTDLTFSPQTPKGKEANWVQTVPGRGWFIVFRLYSPLEPWFDKSWRPGEIEPVKPA